MARLAVFCCWPRPKAFRLDAPLEGVISELKRVYVRPNFRGTGLGRRLTESAMQAAHGIGYARMRLDTLAQMAAAQRLYEHLGFRDIPAYYGEPMDGQRFMEAVLT